MLILLTFQINGPNKLPAPPEISDLRLFLSQFLNLLWILLFGASTLSLIGFFLDTSFVFEGSLMGRRLCFSVT
jgi:hypothetical protein